MATPAAEVECVDCKTAKEEAQAKAEQARAGTDGLRLGFCQPFYRTWAACVEENAGQAKACAAVLEEFKLCHRRAAEAVLASATARRTHQ